MRDTATARNVAERTWAKHGIDRRFWNTQFSDLRFKKTGAGQRSSLSTVAQRGLVKALIKDARKQLVCFGSAPTDNGALRAAYYVAQTLHLNGWRMAVIDLQVEKVSFEHLPKVIVFENILITATDARVERLRDLLHRFRSCLRIVCVAGTIDPYKFITHHIGLEPDGICRLLDR